VDASGNAISPEDAYRQAYARAGIDAPEIEQQGKGYAARSGEGRDHGLYDTEAAAESGSRKVNYGLAKKRADVYDKHGLTEEARGMRRDARQIKLEDAREDRAVEAHTQSTTNNQLTIDVKQREANQTKSWDSKLAALAAQEFKSDDDRAQATVTAFGEVFGPEKAIELQEKYDKRDIAAMQKRSIQIAQGFEEGTRTKGLDGAAEWYDTVNDDKAVKVVRGKSGVEVIEYDPNDPQGTARIVFKGKNDDEVLMQIRARVTPGGTMELAKYELDKLKAEAQIRASDANAAESHAGVGLRRAQASAVGTGVQDSKIVTRLQAQQAHFRTMLTGSRERLDMIDPKKDPEAYAEARGQYDAVAKNLHQTEQQITAALSGGQGGGGGAQGGPDVGTVEDGHVFKGGDPGDPANWVPANGSASRSPDSGPGAAPKQGLTAKPAEPKFTQPSKYTTNPGSRTRVLNPDWTPEPAKFITNPGSRTRVLNPEWVAWQKANTK
jgi:hypothetical protein